jgi:glutamate-ammonia-ligase adenylyltransferase
VLTLDTKVESLLADLPDEKSARLFLERLASEQPLVFQKLERDSALLSDALALVAWSPLLATTLEQNPDYLTWLRRERLDARVRTREQLKESLGRFALTHSDLPTPVLFARFRRRELLRVYLHDVRRAHTLVETTEELSNLADAILDYALNLARQDLDNKYGNPQHHDERGRVAPSEFTIVALGKLGSCELNYSSDIDLLFLYSEEGETSGSGERDKLTNREYFNKLAEMVSKLVGQPAGEGAAYRVDLRLRPHGRDGALACSLSEALKYYSKSAQRWELQALIRSRAAAGSNALFSRFAAAVESNIYQPDVSISDALASVRLAKQKIDRKIGLRNDGFNVKLQRGGIREIEFIAQALQLAHGGRDGWLRVAHTVISLGRLAERNLISEDERSGLSEAYVFLRTLEHRLQMEHGLQTHTLPQAEVQRSLVARRMGFLGPPQHGGTVDFENALSSNTTAVRKAYDRVFAEVETEENSAEGDGRQQNQASSQRHGSSESGSPGYAALTFLAHLRPTEPEGHVPTLESVKQLLTHSIAESSNSQRARALSNRVAASLQKSEDAITFSQKQLTKLVGLCGASELLGEMAASNPNLIASLGAGDAQFKRRDYRAQLRACVDPEQTFPAEISALRKEWAKLLIEIGARDAAGQISLPQSNHLQTELAVASINVAYLIARREMVRRYGRMDGGPRLSVLAVGRLASGGVDYGSDLDVILVYDSLVSSPVGSLMQDEAYARLSELMVAALSSVTRDGYLYRVDLRLRPDGKNGPLIASSESFLDYVRQRSVVWEWLAYVKLRAVAGDLELGRMIETHARHAVHEKAKEITTEELTQETRRMRERLEIEKGRRGRRKAIDIKYGRGGMLDVYFAARYLQLRDDIADEGEVRSTRATLERLEANGSLETSDYEALVCGYELLRTADHYQRLILGKVATLPSTDHPAFGEIARKIGFTSAAEFTKTLSERMQAIREAFDRITETA